MQSWNQCPIFAPSLLKKLGLEGEDDIVFPSFIRIFPCPFCHRLFELV
jgi:hypothetical protein